MQLSGRGPTHAPENAHRPAPHPVRETHATSPAELLAEFRIVYLTGPRQAGKTLAHSISRGLGLEYVTLDDQATLASVQSAPHGFLRSLGDKRVVLDEFQYVPALVPAIKEVSDRLEPHEKGKFLLTRTSRRCTPPEATTFPGCAPSRPAWPV